MKKLLLLAAIGLMGFTFHASRSSADLQPKSFGECYLLFDCQGTSVGNFDDVQCRNVGGRSIKSGSICFNL